MHILKQLYWAGTVTDDLNPSTQKEPAWSTWQVSKQPELHNETLYQKNKTKKQL